MVVLFVPLLYGSACKCMVDRGQCRNFFVPSEFGLLVYTLTLNSLLIVGIMNYG